MQIPAWLFRWVSGPETLQRCFESAYAGENFPAGGEQPENESVHEFMHTGRS